MVFLSKGDVEGFSDKVILTKCLKQKKASNQRSRTIAFQAK